MDKISQTNALSDARIVIARISDSSSEQIRGQQISYATGCIRCAQDQTLINADHWAILIAEIEDENSLGEAVKQKYRGKKEK